MTVPEALTHNGLKVKVGRTAYPPLGLAYIGSVLEKSGYDVTLVDFAAEQVSDIQTIVERIKKHHPDFIGISIISINANQAFKIIPEIKKQVNVPLVAGGAHATYFPENTLKMGRGIDAIVIGEGEAVISELAGALIANKPLNNIKGICYRNKQGEIIKNESRSIIYDLDSIPQPAQHLFNFRLYRPYPFQTKRKPVGTIITSRGCPYAKCTFCYSSVKKTVTTYRRHSVKRVMEEIRLMIERYGIKEIYFLDDDFAAGKEWVNEFCESMHKERIDLSWICMARASSVSKELLSRMAAAGCWSIFFGIESASQHLLNCIKKGVTVEQNRNAVIWAHQAGIQVSAAFMMLLPGETPSDARRNVQFAKELDIEFVAFGPTRPLVATPLFEQCQAYSKDKLPLEQYQRSGDYFIPSVTFIPEGYTKRQALSVCRNAYLEYYLRPRYILNMLKKIRSYADIKRYVGCLRLYFKLVCEGGKV